MRDGWLTSCLLVSTDDIYFMRGKLKMNYYGNCFSSINKLARGMLILVFVFLAVFSYPVQVAQATDYVFDIH